MIVAAPVATPDTVPDAFTDAIDASLVLHEPPLTELVSVTLAPAQTTEGPEIVPAEAPVMTETVVVAVPVPQAEVTENVMVAEPTARPVTMPEAGSTVATEVLLLLHVPPATASARVDVPPDEQSVVVPVIVPAEGAPLMVTDIVALLMPQLLLTRYEIVTVPADTPLTTPKELTVAIELLLLLHAPPLTASASVVVPPTQAEGVPVIVPAEGVVVTENEVVATAVPQLVTTT